MMISGVIAAVAIAVPYVVVPIRRKLGLPTYQWDADPATHPVRIRQREGFQYCVRRILTLSRPAPPRCSTSTTLATTTSLRAFLIPRCYQSGANTAPMRECAAH